MISTMVIDYNGTERGINVLWELGQLIDKNYEMKFWPLKNPQMLQKELE
jgi:hypothetical protein